MTVTRFDPRRSDALRQLLIETVANTDTSLSAPSFPFGRRSVIVVASVLALVIGGGSAAWALGAQTLFFTPAPLDGSEATLGSIPDWPVNANGQTYGVQGNSAIAPDLVLVIATNGAEGYAYSMDLESAEGTGFTSPDEALAWQEAHEGTYMAVPVYESDGTTVIGEFHVGDGDVEFGGAD